MAVSSRRSQVIGALMHAMRRSSAQGVLFSQMVASRVGIGSSDLECLDIIILSGRVTAGELAKATGLTTGAITGLADRLERAGFVRRVRDLSDRRKVWLEALPRAERQIGPWFHSLSGAMDRKLRDYDINSLTLLLEFFEAASKVMTEETAKLAVARRVAELEGG